MTVGTLALVALLGTLWGQAPLASGAPAGQATSVGPTAVLPVDGPVVRPFEEPSGPYGPGHRGVDLAAEPGATVGAALPGVVAFSGEVARRGWVSVDHGAGLTTTYGVLDPRLVTAGQRVAAGEPLGHLTAGAGHVDWGARLDGSYIDPLRLFARWRPHLLPEAR